MTRENRVPERPLTFVRASALYDTERSERIPFRWAAWKTTNRGDAL